MRNRTFLMACTALVLAGLSCGSPQQTEAFDLVISGATVVDGSGSPGFQADIGVKGDTIVRIGQLTVAETSAAKKIIDGTGLVVSPGFIDIHSHSDFSLLVDGNAQSKIHQGVTTEILGEAGSAGPVGGSVSREGPYGVQVDWTTLGEYFDRLETKGISVNVASYVGATQIRRCVLGEESRDPSQEELAEMKRLVKQAMEDGALGFSTSLLVPPNTYHTTHQLAEMASVVKPFGGIYSTHIRTEGLGIEVAVREAIEIGRRAQVPVDIIHLKVADRRLWGSMPAICDLIEEARREGIQATANQYPYIAGQNNLVALVPPWAMEGGRPEMLKRLADPESRARMERDLQQGIPGWFNHYLAMEGWGGCRVGSVQRDENKKFEGKSVAEVAQLWGKSPVDAVFDLLLAEKGSVPAVYFLMSESDVRHAMQRPWVSFGSDGTAVQPAGILGQGKPHPRWYGTFPRILGKYVRQEGVLSLETAIQKMTSLNASKLGITDRGTLSPGMKADFTLFDRHKVIDRATFEDPHQYADGIQHVVVNGVVVLEEGRHRGARPGRVIRGRRAGS